MKGRFPMRKVDQIRHYPSRYQRFIYRISLTIDCLKTRNDLKTWLALLGTILVFVLLGMSCIGRKAETVKNNHFVNRIIDEVEYLENDKAVFCLVIAKEGDLVKALLPLQHHQADAEFEVFMLHRTNSR